MRLRTRSMNLQEDLISLHHELGLYLKPLAKLQITVLLPEKRLVGKVISNWEVMETIKKKVAPDAFLALKVLSSSLARVLLEAEVASTDMRNSVLKKLDRSFIKLSGFSEKFTISAETTRTRFVKRVDWELYFKNANFDDLEIGKRADTVHIDDLPIPWFKGKKTAEEYILEIFGKFGSIRKCLVPIMDPYEERVTAIYEARSESSQEGFKKTSFITRGLVFDAFIQYVNHEGFCKCVDSLNGMKIVKLISDDDEPLYCNFKLDFDRFLLNNLRSGRLSEAVIEERAKIKANLMESDKIKQMELDAQKSEQQRIMEEARKNELKRIEEEEELEKLQQIHEEDEKKKQDVEAAQKEEQAINKLKIDIQTLKDRIKDVEDCRMYCAVHLLKKALSEVKHDLTSKSRKRKRSRSSSHHRDRKYR